MSYLLANGCSFTDKTYNSQNDGFYHTQEEKTELGFPEGDWPMWPEYVGEKLGLPVVNLGKSGGSNQRMYETTLAQVHKNKPAAIMNLWTGGGRNDLLGHNLNEYSFINVIHIANNILKCNNNIMNYTKSEPMSMIKMAWEAVRLYYPTQYDACSKRYAELCNSDETLPTLSIINKHKVWWPEEKALEFFMKYYYHNSNINGNDLKNLANRRINFELQPLLNTYYMCKSMDIPLITLSCYSFGGTYGPPRGDGVQKPNIKSSNLNIFEKMIISAVKIAGSIDDCWISNPAFKALDDLIFEDDYVMYTWPNHSRYQKNASIDQWLDGWKDLSYKDQHPHWDTQKLIGDVFYDLYKKNYS
jgi:hypothetical protein